MAGFPSLQPAFTVRVDLDAALPIGSASRGTPLVVVPMISGTVISEAGFEPNIDAQLLGTGYDYIRADGDQERNRLDVRAQVKNKDGSLLAMYYKGPLNLSEGVKACLSGSPTASTTDYGDSFVAFEFETGSPRFKSLEGMTFVGAGHFVKEPGQNGLIVEYKVSRVVKG